MADYLGKTMLIHELSPPLAILNFNTMQIKHNVNFYHKSILVIQSENELFHEGLNFYVNRKMIDNLENDLGISIGAWRVKIKGFQPSFKEHQKTKEQFYFENGKWKKCNESKIQSLWQTWVVSKGVHRFVDDDNFVVYGYLIAEDKK